MCASCCLSDSFSASGYATKLRAVAHSALWARLWRRAAESGYTAAQYRLGLAYQQGHDVPQDLVEAESCSGRSGPGGIVRFSFFFIFFRIIFHTAEYFENKSAPSPRQKDIFPESAQQHMHNCSSLRGLIGDLCDVIHQFGIW